MVAFFALGLAVLAVGVVVAVFLAAGAFFVVAALVAAFFGAAFLVVVVVVVVVDAAGLGLASFSLGSFYMSSVRGQGDR